jgi:hypothetical protein
MSEVETHEDDLEDYGGGSIEARHGYVPIWLLVVYFVLFAWAFTTPTTIGAASGRDGFPAVER